MSSLGPFSPADPQSVSGRPVVCRGVRGATTIEHDNRDEVLSATRQLLALMIRRNGIDSADVASVIFTVTRDVTAEFPAVAARQLGWIDVPLLCGYEVSVPGSLSHCIRVLVHWNTTKTQQEIEHTYMREATALRPDLMRYPPVDLDELEAWIRVQMGEPS
ncbi:MAG: chorismate mutase [Planctomycetaceae bacterium]|nr:MAG: chorismate mutase [Planctomycetaceae bacterium]